MLVMLNECMLIRRIFSAAAYYPGGIDGVQWSLDTFTPYFQAEITTRENA